MTDIPRDVDLALTNTPWPQDQNLISWSSDPAAGGFGGSLMTAGTVWLSTVQIRRPVTISSLLWWVSTAGATPTAGQNFVGLYDSSGVRLAAVDVDADISSTGLKTTAITPVSVGTGAFWVAFLFNATTAPTLVRGTAQTGAAAAANAGLPNSRLRFAINATSQTSLPSPLVLSSNSGSGIGGPWVAVA